LSIWHFFFHRIQPIIKDSQVSRKLGKSSSVSLGQLKHNLDMSNGLASDIIEAGGNATANLNDGMAGDFLQDEVITFGSPYTKEYSISGSTSQTVTFQSSLDVTPYGGLGTSLDFFVTLEIEVRLP
jgi:hypothetical protein